MSEIMKSGEKAEDEKDFTSRHSFAAHASVSLTENKELSDVRLALGQRSGSNWTMAAACRKL